MAAALLHLASCQGAARDSEPGGQVSRSLQVRLELSAASTKQECEHGEVVDAPDSHGLLAPGAAYVLSHRVRVRDEPRARADASTELARTYEENALTLFREDGASGRTSLGGLRNALETPQVEQVRTAEGAFEPAAGAPSDLVADLLGDWLIAGGDGEPVDAARFVHWLYAGGLEFPGYERPMDTGSWPSVHVALVPELPPDPAFWMQGAQGSVRLTRTDGGRAYDVGFEVGGRGDLRPWIASILGEDLAPFVEMMGYDGAVSWTLAGSGVLAVPNADGRVQSIHLEGELTVDYSLAWSYAWDAPQVEQFQFKRLEAWSGTLALDGQSLP